MAITIIRNGIGGTTGTPPNLTGQAGSMIGVLDHCLVTTLGWTKVYSGTNLAAYRAPTGVRGYLYVDDTNATATRVYGYESMSSISVGTGKFPTEQQLSGGLYWMKSTSADSTARNWFFISNGKLFYLLIVPGGVPTSATVVYAFGDFVSKKSGADLYNAFIQGQVNTTLSTSSLYTDYYAVSGYYISTGMYLMRPYTGIGGSVPGARQCDSRFGSTGSNVFGVGTVPFPAPITGGLLMSPVWVAEPVPPTAALTGDIRGLLPGWWCCLQTRPLSNGDTFTGPTGTILEGRTLEAFTSSNSGQHFFETSDTWDS